MIEIYGDCGFLFVEVKVEIVILYLFFLFKLCSIIWNMFGLLMVMFFV